MASAHFTVIHAGPHVSVQDGGRLGMARFGVTGSGAMDRGALKFANTALGNPLGVSVIEISIGGLTLKCTQGSITFAVAGGGFVVTIDDVVHTSWCVATIHAGSTLTIRPGSWGSWAYLAFAGDLQCKTWLGSTSTHGSSGFGGGMIAARQAIAVENANVISRRDGVIPYPPRQEPRSYVRVILGPQDRFFTADALANFQSQRFTLTNSYDRMGVRLSGPVLTVNGALNMPSEAIVRGSIQVAGDGVATVLLADHQTTGGYPKIATVLSDDLDGLAQLRSGAAVKFRAVTPQFAIEATRARQKVLGEYIKSLAG
jgi:biotin-dependent carboxylase-like uncharacterized protein